MLKDEFRDFTYNAFNRRRKYATWFVIGCATPLASLLVRDSPLFIVPILIGVTVALTNGILWILEPKRFGAVMERGRRSSPEAEYVVETGDDAVCVSDPKGQRCEIPWAELEAVDIVTTSGGPYLADYWYELRSSRAVCHVPMGATNDDALAERLRKLPGWSFEQEIAAASSVEDQRFTCWRRPSFVNDPLP